MDETPSRSRRHWLRFSLRSLLIAVTLLCVVLGTWVHRSLRQRDALATLQQIDADSFYQYSFQVGEGGQVASPWPAWLDKWLGIDFLANVSVVEVTQFDEQVLRALKSLPGLESLSFYSVDLTDADLARLGALPNLKLLCALSTSKDFSGEGFAGLESLRHLEVLQLAFSDNITDQGLAHLGCITSLRRFEVGSTSLWTNQGVAQLRGLVHLESLSLVFNADLTDSVLEPLQTLANLKTVSLDYLPGETVHAGLKYLNAFTQLEELELHDSNMAGALAMLPALPKLKRLDLRFDSLPVETLSQLARFPLIDTLSFDGSCRIDDPFVEALGRLPRLRRLAISIASDKVTDEAVHALSRLTSLVQLDLDDCEQLSEDGLLRLAKLTQLKVLIIRGKGLWQLSADIRDKLRRALPGCHITYEPRPLRSSGSFK